MENKNLAPVNSREERIAQLRAAIEAQEAMRSALGDATVELSLKPLRGLLESLTEEAAFDTDDLPDEIDLASSEYTQSMVFRLRDREKFLLKKIDDALARIENGNFGICEICEEEISVKRLEARPVTTMCIRCKEEQEKQEKSYG